MGLTDIPSSSPAFGTPAHPILPRKVAPIPVPPALKPSILPILLPPATLRPQAFRTFTKKHNLTLTSAALGTLATFIGRHCGTGWREQGLAEGVLEEVAKSWKKCGGSVIVEGDAKLLKDILKTIEGCMSSGKVLPGKNALSRQGSFAFGAEADGRSPPPLLERESSFGMSSLQVDEEDDPIRDPREWIKVISALEQPRLAYNGTKKHFEM
jgi:DNA polymerase epsilon subunit 2